MTDTDLHLTLALANYDRVMPLVTGEVKPAGITLHWQGTPGGGVPRVFFDMIKNQRYDVSEMSNSSFLRMKSIGWPYKWLGVFHQRTFSYVGVHIREGSGIRQNHPEDLEGKRFGMADFQQTAAMMLRQQFQLMYGVKPESMTYYQERSEKLSHTGESKLMGLSVPKKIKLNFASEAINAMFNHGTLDACMGAPRRVPEATGGIERAFVPLSPTTKVIPLFSDAKAEAIKFYKKTGVYPAHHGTVVRESILKEHPWVAHSLFVAFDEAKKIAIQRLRAAQRNDLLVWRQELQKEVDDIFGPDPYPYGIKANEKLIDMLQTFSVQEELTPKKQPIEELVAEEILEMETAL